MQGAGNDYLYVDCFSQPKPKNLAVLSRRISDRRFGVGSDGLILILPSSAADCRMEMYNADGSRGKMCGNGIRCVAKYVYDRGIARKKELKIDSDSGIKKVLIKRYRGKVVGASVDMGKPVFERKKIPMRGKGADGLGQRIRVLGKSFVADCLSMGNPHCVVFVRDENRVPIERFGPRLETHPLFPEKTNVEFVRRMNNGDIAQRTWERGSGETMACGTGACAAAVATILRRRSKHRVKVYLRGGVLEIEWRPGESVWMTGPAEEVFSGVWD